MSLRVRPEMLPLLPAGTKMEFESWSAKRAERRLVVHPRFARYTVGAS